MIESGLDEAADLCVREPVIPKLVDEVSRETGGGASPTAPPLQILTYGDKRSRSMSEFDHTVALELRISLDDRVRTDHKFLSMGTNCGQLITGTQETALNRVPDLLHQLDVDRNAAGGIQSEQSGAHCFSVMVQFYCGTVKQA